MRYSLAHKEETHRRLLDSSRSIAKQHGFDSTGVDALMSAIGMTSGAFYTHFKSKEELFKLIIEREVDNSCKMLAGDKEEGTNAIEKAVRGYLSFYHALHPEAGCALPTLGAEIARSGPDVKRVAEQGLKRIHAIWSEQLGDADHAWAVISQCVGALVLCRVVEAEKTRKEILAANRRSLTKTHLPNQKRTPKA
jgi:TetR/AcrR family transcriptional regulator, transcriptional repressor for nem operon